MSHLRSPRAIAGVLLALLMGALPVVTAPAANAADEGSRYWGVWTLQNGAWKFATEAPASQKVKQGDLIGFRYAAQSMNDSRPPRDTTITFAKVCGTQKVDAGKVAVAVAIDFGRPADSAENSERVPGPRAQCAVVDQGATVASTLRVVSDVRSDAKGAICGIDGYPTSGCLESVTKLSDAAKAKDDKAEIVVADPGAVVVTNNDAAAGEQPQQDAAANPSGTASPAEGSDSGPGNGLILGLAAAALLLLAALAFWFLRRNKGQRSSRVVGETRRTAGATRADEASEAEDGDYPTRRSRQR